MKRWMPRVVVAGLLAIAMMAGTLDLAAADAPPSLSDRPIGWFPVTDGAFAVWVEYGTSLEPEHYAVWAANLTTGEAFAVRDDICGWPIIKVSDGVVVWHEKVDCVSYIQVVRGRDLRTGEEFSISNPSGSATLGTLDGPNLIWWATDETIIDGPVRLMLQRIDVPSDPVLLQEFSSSDPERPHGNLEMSGVRLVWSNVWPGIVGGWRLNLLRIPETDWTVLTHGDRSDLFAFDFEGDIIVYTSHWAVHVIHRATMQMETLPGRAKNPTTDGRYVFWEDTRFIVEGTDTNEARVDLWAYDLSSHSSFPVVVRHFGNWDPMARNGALVWQSGAVWVADILPSAPQPDPGTTSRNWLYFTLTGHYLSYGFKDFWLRSGGLPVFGYPLTIEYTERNPELGTYHTVQYTERQRFEYHPDLAGTAYETLLGRLGYADAQRRGLLSHPAFQPLPTGTKNDAHSDFFPETGHRLSHGFRAYWHGHGLDFGDPGVSYRESLALFGYPISEEFVDPETGLVTQYFERAVFEYHPDNPEPYKILLRRLGAEEMERRDW